MARILPLLTWLASLSLAKANPELVPGVWKNLTPEGVIKLSMGKKKHVLLRPA